MNQRQLSYFIEVYRRQSIKQAAYNLCISQQGLSRTIISLEHELGTTLFLRKGSKMEPTEKAEELLVHAQRIIEEFELLEDKSSTRKKRVVIYSVDGVLGYLTEQFLTAFYREHPDICLVIMEVPQYDAVKYVKEGNCDFAMLQQPVGLHGFADELLFTMEFCMVVNRENPLAEKDTFGDADWHEQNIAGRGYEYDNWRHYIKQLEKKGYCPNVVLESNRADILLSMAENNLAVACVTKDVVRHYHSDRTKVLKFDDHRADDEVYFSYSLTRPLSKQAKLFRDFLMSWCREQQNG